MKLVKCKQDLLLKKTLKKNLIRTATATDKEDEVKDLEITVKDFDINDFVISGEYGGCTIKYEVTDKVGNKTDYITRAYIIRSGKVERINYIRFIDRENYNKSDPKKGGLLKNSIWKVNPVYKKIITDAFDRIDNNTCVVRYEFKRDDIKACQEFVKTHGRGNFDEDDALEKWLEEFKHCKTIDTL